MRILPSSASLNSEYWITDKVRFNFDGYVKQRLLKPLFIFDYRLFYLTYGESINTYKSFLLQSISALSNKSIKNLMFLNKLGSFLYLEDLYSLKYYTNFLGAHITSTAEEYHIDSDFRENFYSSAVFSLDKYKNFFFFNINTRLESPVMNLKLKEHFFEEVCSVYSYGVFSSQFEIDEFGGNNSFFESQFIVENLDLDFLLIEGYIAKILNKYLLGFFSYLKTLHQGANIEL